MKFNFTSNYFYVICFYVNCNELDPKSNVIKMNVCHAFQCKNQLLKIKRRGRKTLLCHIKDTHKKMTKFRNILVDFYEFNQISVSWRWFSLANNMFFNLENFLKLNKTCFKSIFFLTSFMEKI